MSEESSHSAGPQSDWRFKLGLAMFLLSIAIPILGIPIVTMIGLSHTVTATLSGICVVGAEVLGVTAVTVMGKTGYNIIINYVAGFLKRYGPPQKVSSGRYKIGLVMICLPIFVGWITPYVADMVLGPDGHLVLYGLGLDLLLLAGLFVVGGDFWDKLRSLFVHDAEVSFPGT